METPIGKFELDFFLFFFKPSLSEPFVATQVTEAGTVGGVSVSGLFTAVQAEDGYNSEAYDIEQI